ncbi:MAG: hypothetical protein HDS16_00525 [Bacteroides sp.]|nr:hypothetical protein [Bacteroidales bacterium]MBD5301479.1 hypothetical protein [Bacteroides sp.]MBD5349032.1 hypothetical protein [Bacteroides sp.]
MADYTSPQWANYNTVNKVSASTFPNTPYISPAPGKIPLVAVNPVPADVFLFLDEESQIYADTLLKAMKYALESGCNALSFGGSIVQTKAMLDAVSDLNLKSAPGVLVNSPLLSASTEDCLNLIGEVRYNPLVKGWFIMDRPNYWDWGNVKPGLNTDMIYNRLTLGYRIALKYELYETPVEDDGITTQMAMFNLAGSDNPDILGRCNDYDEYLTVINKLFVPPLWSLSHYPFSIPDRDLISLSDIKTDTVSFYSYLRKFRNTSYQREKRFWFTCQIGSFRIIDTSSDITVFRFPNLELSMMRFEAFSALTYGAQGILFSDMGLQSISLSGSNKKEPLTSLIHYDLKRGIWIDESLMGALKTVCREISECTQVFLDSECVEIGHVGQTYGQVSDNIIFPFGCISAIQYSGDGVLAAILKRDNRHFMVMVNHQPLSPQNLIITLNSKYKYPWSYLSGSHTTEESKITDISESIDSSLNVPATPIRFTLPAGGMVIFEWS